MDQELVIFKDDAPQINATLEEKLKKISPSLLPEDICSNDEFFLQGIR